jgi:hypothetical protein
MDKHAEAFIHKVIHYFFTGADIGRNPLLRLRLKEKRKKGGTDQQQQEFLHAFIFIF